MKKYLIPVTEVVPVQSQVLCASGNSGGNSGSTLAIHDFYVPGESF